MALPTLSKTWIYNVEAIVNPMYSGNTTTFYAFDYLAWMVGIKLAMCKNTGWVDKDGLAATQNFPWTVKASSDGDTANASDNWTSYLSLVNNPATPTYKISVIDFGWCVLENAALSNFEFLLGTGNNGGVGYQNKHVAWCSWSGFDTSSPLVTAFPTASDSLQLIGTGNAGVSTTGGIGDNVPFDSVIHIAMSTDGECTRVIGCRANIPVLFWQFEKAKNPVSGWTDTIFSTSRGNTVPAKNQGLSSEFLTTRSTGVRLSGANRLIYMTTEGYGTSLTPTAMRTPGHLDNEFKLYPAALLSDFAPAGRVGSVFDMWFTPLSATPGTTFPESGNRQFLSLGGAVIPWTNTRLFMSP